MTEGKSRDAIKVHPVTMPDDMDADEKASTREAAEFEAKTALHVRDTLWKEAIASMRWIQASLLLVNGGGAAAVLTATAIPAASRATAGAFFVGGIAMALFASLLGVWLIREAPRKLTEFAGYWISVKNDLLRVESIEREFIIWSRGAEKRALWTYVPGVLSFAAFLAGSTFIGCAILHSPGP